MCLKCPLGSFVFVVCWTVTYSISLTSLRASGNHPDETGTVVDNCPRTIIILFIINQIIIIDIFFRCIILIIMSIILILLISICASSLLISRWKAIDWQFGKILTWKQKELAIVVQSGKKFDWKLSMQSWNSLESSNVLDKEKKALQFITHSSPGGFCWFPEGGW